MGLWTALFWGAFTSAALYLGQLLAGPIGSRNRILGLVMGFGAGTMVCAVAYELIPETSLEHGWKIGLGVLLGALVYFAGDALIDRRGGKDRHRIAGGGRGFRLGVFPRAPFAGGAVLMMLTDSMFPEAFKFGGRAVGLLTVLGYLVAGAFSVT